MTRHLCVRAAAP